MGRTLDIFFNKHKDIANRVVYTQCTLFHFNQLFACLLHFGTVHGLHMKTLLIILLLIHADLVAATEYPATLVEVKDGDTVRLAIHVWPGQTITTNVRVVGIDTPEKGWRAKCPKEAGLGMAATAYTTEFVSGEGQITIRNVKHGKFAGRMLGSVSMSGIDLGQALLAAGLAREYDGGGKRSSWCDP